MVERIGDKDYDSLINALERLSNLPYSYKVKDFIIQYTKPLMSQLQNFDVPKPKYDSEGRAYVTTYGMYNMEMNIFDKHSIGWLKLVCFSGLQAVLS